jgi:hypothetical protein
VFDFLDPTAKTESLFSRLTSLCHLQFIKPFGVNVSMGLKTKVSETLSNVMSGLRPNESPVSQNEFFLFNSEEQFTYHIQSLSFRNQRNQQSNAHA